MLNEFFDLIKGDLATYIIGILTIVFSYFGHKLKVIIEKYQQDETIRKVVKTGVTAIEQIYKEKGCEEKLELAKDKIREMLLEKKLKISDLELWYLIEENVNCLKDGE